MPGGMMGDPGAGMTGTDGMMGGSGPGPQQVVPGSSLDTAKQAFQAYVDRTGNQDLALDEVMQFQWNYYAIVKEKSTGSLAFELLADPQTGTVFPEVGPNMMWNTKYGPILTGGAGGGMMGDATAEGMMGGSGAQGMMGGMGGAGMMGGTWGPTPLTTQPTVTAGQSTQIAQQWLDQYQAGSATEMPDSFPGYYTLHITKDGMVAGMLSVNAYTGQVWYHAWHGAFVANAT